MKRAAFLHGSALLLAIGIAGCVVGPDYAPPAASELSVPPALPSTIGQPEGVELLGRWWTRLDEPALDALVERLLADNPDLASAEARFEQARELVTVERAILLPNIGSTGSVSRSIGSDTPAGDITQFQNGVSASWEADISGGNRRAVEAARAQAGASGAFVGAQRIALTGALARAFVDERLARERLAIALDTLESQRHTRQIAEWRVEAGLATGIDREQARQLVLQTEAGIPSIRSSQRNAANRIAVLAGAPPGAVDAIIADGTGIPQPLAVPALLPVDIVRRRPDVANAERTLAAEVARIGVAAARLYPSLSLSGSIGGNATNFGGLVDSITGTISALISQTLFDAGRNRASVRAQEAAADGALADYRATVLAALEDADNAYDAVGRARERVVARRGAETAARNATVYLRQQYASGLVDFSVLLDAERTLLSASDLRAQAEAQAVQATITLIQALGGDDGGAAPVPMGDSTQ